LSFATLVTDLLSDGQRLHKVGDGAPRLAQGVVDTPQVVQGLRFARPVADLLSEGQCLITVGDSAPGVSQVHIREPQVVQRLGFDVPVVQAPRRYERALPLGDAFVLCSIAQPADGDRGHCILQENPIAVGCSRVLDCPTACGVKVGSQGIELR
jgi:hypothetical protein